MRYWSGKWNINLSDQRIINTILVRKNNINFWYIVALILLCSDYLKKVVQRQLLQKRIACDSFKETYMTFLTVRLHINVALQNNYHFITQKKLFLKAYSCKT